MLDINQIEVCYNGIPAVYDVSIKVEEGEIIAIVGNNGSGKSTVLKAVSGVVRPSKGTIKFLRQEISSLPKHEIVKLGISHVPEGRRLFDKLTVLDNLRLGAHIKSKADMEESLQQIYNLFPLLKERKSQKAGTLSGGEQQMLAIARGLMSHPMLLMLDEPSLGLMPTLVIELQRLIRMLNDQGITILLVEQNVRHALEMADRAYVLQTGRTELEGSGKELLDNPLVKKAYLGM